MRATPANTPLTHLVWQAPLVPLAVAATLGLMMDRHCPLPAGLCLGVTLALLLIWGLALVRCPAWVSLGLVWAAWVAAGALYHSWFTYRASDNDLRLLAGEDARL